MTQVTFDLTSLSNGRPGITSAMGTLLSEAATVAFDSAGCSLPAQVEVTGAHRAKPTVSGPAITEQMRRTYADPDIAKEYGACGLATLAVEHFEKLTVYEMARKTGHGFDYYLGPTNRTANIGGNFFEAATHTMEVSGTSINDNAALLAREREKLTRLQKRAQPFPCIVVIVDFLFQRARLVKYALAA